MVPGVRQWAQTETRDVLPEHQEALPYCVGDRAMELSLGSPSLEIFKSPVDMVVGNLL